MNRISFMKQLESLLQNISPSEREEALQYYNDYFNDAGEENEQAVIEALGNPAKVAENIKRDLYGSGYGDNMYQRATASDRAVVAYQEKEQNAGPTDSNSNDYSTNNDYMLMEKESKKKEGMSAGMIVLIIILCILASPIIVSLVSGVLSVVLGVICTWFAIILAAGILAISFVAVMIILLVVGIMAIVADPLVGVATIGIGMVFGGFGVLALMLTVAMAGIATPAIGRGIAALVRKMTNKTHRKQFA